MRRRFRRRPPSWFWLVLAVLAALVGRKLLNQAADQSTQPTLLPDEAVVSAIVDGQTLEIIPIAGRASIQVRLLGIKISDNAQAQKWLAANVVGQNIRIARDKRRQASDGAQLAYVSLGNLLINAELIRQGYARHEPYPGDSESYARQLRAASMK